jgi:hypothetical protein
MVGRATVVDATSWYAASYGFFHRQLSPDTQDSEGARRFGETRCALTSFVIAPKHVLWIGKVENRSAGEEQPIFRR